MNRRSTAALTLASIAVSAALLSVVDRVRTDAQTSFANTISGTDLIVGARSGDLNLLLYSVFRIGNPTNNIAWDSYREIDARREVDWAMHTRVIACSVRTSATSSTISTLTSGR